MVGVTQSMFAVKGPVTHQPIMHAGAMKGWADANGLHAIASAQRVGRVVSQVLRAWYMHPLNQLLDPQARFILMQHCYLGQCLLELLFHSCQKRVASSDEVRQTACRHLHTKPFSQQVRRTSVRDELPLHQRDRQGRQTRSILGWPTHRCRKCCPRQLVTLRTPFLFCSLFHYPQPMPANLE